MIGDYFLTISWLIAIIIFALAEAATASLVSIWFIGGAFVSLILSLFNVNYVIQITAFVVVSLLLLIITRPLAKKYLNNKIIKTNSEALIGKQAIVTDTIDNLLGTGRVKVEGKDWSARATDGELIKAGETVIIQEINGVKLIVSRQ
jgi:membrane protein implicated in regulation of membrane protease activity